MKENSKFPRADLLKQNGGNFFCDIIRSSCCHGDYFLSEDLWHRALLCNAHHIVWSLYH